MNLGNQVKQFIMIIDHLTINLKFLPRDQKLNYFLCKFDIRRFIEINIEKRITGISYCQAAFTKKYNKCKFERSKKIIL